MSEYQLYEFQSLDRTLTPADRAYLQSLSSRVEITATSARFNYSYGDFRGEPLNVLERCFDLLLYQANFGVTQLAIRLPKEIATPALYEPYCVPDGILVQQTRQSVIINISLSYEDYGGGWLGDEDNLSALIPIRAALMRGDLRVLYLAWLATGFSAESFDWDETIEPPVPPNLNQRSPELTHFADVFEIDADLIETAAIASQSVLPVVEPIEAWILALSEKDRNQYLLRVAKGESHVGVELMQRLRQQFGSSKTAGAQGSRTFAEMVSIAKEKTQKRQQAEQVLTKKAEQVRVESLGGPKVELRWLVVMELVESGQANSYEKAVGHLSALRAIAEKSNKLAAFYARLEELKQTASRKKSFIAKVKESGL